MPVHDRSSFENIYAGQPRWEIGRPQQALLDVADNIKGSILDSGCGTGEISLYFANRGHKVTGIDFLVEPIEIAKQKAIERGISATFFVMDALTLKDRSERFDNVIDSGLFHVFSDEDRRRYVEGLASVLKPGGRLFLLCFSDSEPGDQGPRRVSRKELEVSFADGWAIESIEPSQYEVRPDSPGFDPSVGGPKAWFMTARRAKSNAILPPAPVGNLIGFSMKSVERGHAIFEMEVDERHHNPMGTLHGGIYCDLADAAMGYAYASTLIEGETFTTVELKINFFRAVRKSRLTAEATVVKAGRTLGYVECEIRDQDGKLVAKAASTCMTLRKPE